MDVYGFLFGRFAAGRRAYRQKCTVQTVGFISEVRRTGKVVQHVPQILILVNALDEEGNYFQTSLKLSLIHIYIELVLLTGGHSQWYFVKEMLTGRMPEICGELLPKIAENPERVIPVTRPQDVYKRQTRTWSRIIMWPA